MAQRKSKKRRVRARQEAKKRAERLRWLRIGGIVALVIAALAILGLYRSSTAPAITAPEEIMAANIDGSPEAPVQIVEFGDFGCHSCRAWHNAGVKEQLKTEFGDQLAFTFRHFPVITRQSPQAAEAGQCAAEQDAFWTYHDYIYESTPEGALAEADLRLYASAIGLDTGTFDQCLDSGKYSTYVSRDQQAALVAGARGTPTFFINERQVTPTYQAMAAMIREELAN